MKYLFMMLSLIPSGAYGMEQRHTSKTMPNLPVAQSGPCNGSLLRQAGKLDQIQYENNKQLYKLNKFLAEYILLDKQAQSLKEQLIKRQAPESYRTSTDIKLLKVATSINQQEEHVEKFISDSMPLLEAQRALIAELQSSIESVPDDFSAVCAIPEVDVSQNPVE